MKALVTGGGGFLGGAIVRRLLHGRYQVASFARGHYPGLEASGVTCIRGDLRHRDDVMRAVEGCQAVFHVAAKAGVWGKRRDFESTNVRGTRHVLDACRTHRVRRLIYTSSPSVVFDGCDALGIDESVPYPDRYLAEYPRTKAAAERLVLAAHGPGLRTIALRPHLIWGPGDPHLVPRLLDRARRSRLRLVGDGANPVDSTYVDNAALAHLLAAERLDLDPGIGGRAYFISDGEPMPIAELINRILAAAGLGPVTRSISPRAAFALGASLEMTYRLLRRRGEPPMTRFVALQLSTAHCFDLSAARGAFGYRPEVSVDEGMAALARALSDPDRATFRYPHE